jgi:hypothetical protein
MSQNDDDRAELIAWGMRPPQADKLLAGDPEWIRFMLREFRDDDVDHGEPYPAREIVRRLATEHGIDWAAVEADRE